MTKLYEMVQMVEGNELVIAKGTEQEIIEAWENEKNELTDWLVNETDLEEDEENAKQARETEVGVLRDLEYIFNNYLNYGFVFELELREV